MFVRLTGETAEITASRIILPKAIHAMKRNRPWRRPMPQPSAGGPWLYPAEFRAACREGRFSGTTSGVCPGFAQAHRIVLPSVLAGDFRSFCGRNPRPCPLLAASERPVLGPLAPGADLRTDLPRYRIARRDQCPAPARRASRCPTVIVWVEHRTGGIGMAAAGEAQILTHRLAYNMSAGVKNAGHNGGVDFRGVAFQSTAAVHHGDAGDTDVVLDGQGFSRQRP